MSVIAYSDLDRKVSGGSVLARWWIGFVNARERAARRTVNAHLRRLDDATLAAYGLTRADLDRDARSLFKS